MFLMLKINEVSEVNLIEYLSDENFLAKAEFEHTDLIVKIDKKTRVQCQNTFIS